MRTTTLVGEYIFGKAQRFKLVVNHLLKYRSNFRTLISHTREYLFIWTFQSQDMWRNNNDLKQHGDEVNLSCTQSNPEWILLWTIHDMTYFFGILDKCVNIEPLQATTNSIFNIDVSIQENNNNNTFNRYKYFGIWFEELEELFRFRWKPLAF